MQKHFKFLAAAAVAACLTTQALAQDDATPSRDTVVATVNGAEITLGHIIIAVATLPPEYQQLDDQTLFDGILNQLVQQEALAQTMSEKLTPRVVLSLENEARALKAGEVMDSEVSKGISESDVQASYDESYGALDPQEEYNAAHILLETEEEAKAVQQELKDGAMFAEVAREKSIGPSGPNGGSLGWFGAGMMVPAFEAATIALKPGEISDPVETQFGWHVILLNDVRAQNIPTLEEKRAEIEQQLGRQLAQDLLERLTDEADVNVTAPEDLDVSLIRSLDLLEP